jgi:hypothetical protein
VEIYCRAGQTTCTLRAGQLRPHIQYVIRTYCFSTATVVAQTLLNVTLRMNCVSCIYLAALPSINCTETRVFRICVVRSNRYREILDEGGVYDGMADFALLCKALKRIRGTTHNPKMSRVLGGTEGCPSCSTRKFKYKYINHLHVNVMVLNRHHHPSSKAQSS